MCVVLGVTFKTCRRVAFAMIGLMLSVFDPATSIAQGIPPQVGHPAPEFELTGLDQQKHSLSDFTKAGRVVLVFLRGYPGYQCPICSTQFASFLGKAEELKKAGATVLFVYPGPSQKLSDRAHEFVKGKDYPKHFEILLDPDYKLTEAYGVRWKANGETAYPSTFIIDREGAIQFVRISKTHGGRAKVSEVLKSLTDQLDKGK